MLLIQVILWKQAHWMIENPASSIARASKTFVKMRASPRFPPSTEVDHAPRFAELLSKRVVYKVTTWLGEFGAESPKCVKLWGSDPFIQQLHRTGLNTFSKL